MSPVSLLFLGLTALAVAGCGAVGDGGVETPLLDGLHQPEVLVESRTLEPPPSLEGNRFVRGWALWRRRSGAETWLIPDAGGAWVELVTVEPRARRLVLATEIFASEPDDRVEVRLAGAEPFQVPLASPLEIPLPEDLPAGRVSVELGFPAAAELALQTARPGPTLPAGEVLFAEGGVEQSPASLVDFVRRVGPETRLAGRFEPPGAAGREQRFALIVEAEDAPPRTLFEWRGRWWERLLGERRLDVPIGDRAGLARIRLAAYGRGAPARWSDLRLSEPAPAAAPPAASPPPAPRLVLLYVFDALRADAVGGEWAGRPVTPVFDRVAAGGVELAAHASVAPNTLPSTKSLFTGQAFLERGHTAVPPDGPETLAEAFARAGYLTAAFSGNGYVSPPYGLTRGFAHHDESVTYEDYPPGGGRFNDNAARVHRAALDWLESVPAERPVFLYLHTIHPHNPYDPPASIRSRFLAGIGSRTEAQTRDLLDIRHLRRETSPEDEAAIRALYAGGMAYNDAELEGLLERLLERYPPGEVLVVLTSDHGEELFDHGGVLHGYTLYEEQLRIPLVFWWPGRLEPRRLELATDNLDLHETFRALVGASPSGAGDGRSLWGALAERGPERPADPVRFAAASSVSGGIFMAASERYKLIWAPRNGRDFGMGEGRGRSWDPEYLFDLERDPGETSNLAGAPLLEAAWLRSRLLAWIERGRLREADTGGEAPILDEEARSRLEALGYLD